MNPIAITHTSTHQLYDDLILLLRQMKVRFCHWADLLLSALKQVEDPELRAVPSACPVISSRQLDESLKQIVFTAPPPLLLDDVVP